MNLSHLKKSKDYSMGFEVGFLLSVLLNNKPKIYSAKFQIENQEQVFLNAQQAGYTIGEWRETPDGLHFTVEFVSPNKRRVRGNSNR